MNGVKLVELCKQWGASKSIPLSLALVAALSFVATESNARATPWGTQEFRVGFFGLTTGKGVKVLHTFPNCRARLFAGDLITAVNSTRVWGIPDYRMRLQEAYYRRQTTGRSIWLTVVRNGTTYYERVF